MPKFEKEYIPLALEMHRHVVSYIINNELIGCEIYSGNISRYPHQAVQLLGELFTHEETKDIFPDSLEKIFSEKGELLNGTKNDFLIDETEFKYHYHCLGAEMAITENTEKPILFKNINYYNGKNNWSFDSSIQLSARETFLLLGNIALTNQYFLFEDALDQNNNLALDSVTFNKKIAKMKVWGTGVYGLSYEMVTLFTISYIEFLKEQIIARKLTPEEILHYSGVTPLILLQSLPVVADYISGIITKIQDQQGITHNKLVQYYTLLYSLDDFTVKNKSNQLFYDFLKIIPEQSLLKKFPI